MRLPPHAADIMRARRAGKVPVPGVFGHIAVLPDWNMETSGAFVLAPPDLDPVELDFSFAAGLNVTLFMRESDFLLWRQDLLLPAIMRGSPKRITIINTWRAETGLCDGVFAIFDRVPISE